MLDDTQDQNSQITSESARASRVTQDVSEPVDQKVSESKNEEEQNASDSADHTDSPTDRPTDSPITPEPELAPPAPAIVEAEKEEAEVKAEPITSESVGQDVSEPVDQKTGEPDQKKGDIVSDSAEITDTPTDGLTDSQATDAARLNPDPPSVDGTSLTLTPNGPKARWYVVHTYSGHEAKVAATLKQRVASQKLEDKVLDIMVPTQDKIEIREGKKARIKEKIFPGYLLIKMVLDDNTWLIVRTTPGITSFVGMGNRPTPLPDEEVNTIQKYMTMEAPKFKASFSVGEAVKITDGPFSEFLGSISEIDETRGKMKVLVSIFGRETPVELDFLQVAKL